MANTNKFVVKNGLHTQNIDNVSPDGLNTIQTEMLDGGTLSFSGNTGQLFSITDSMSGVIYSVNDISGIPSIEVYDTGEIRLAEFSGNVNIYNDLFVTGDTILTGNISTSNAAGPIILDEVASATNPTLIPNKTELDTGIGWASGALHGIIGGTSRFNISAAGIAATNFSGSSSGTNTGDQTITLTGDVTGSGTGSFAATIASNSVTLAKMADVATGTVFYRKTAATGDPEVQTLATLKTDLGLTGTNTGDQSSVTGNAGTVTVGATNTGVGPYYPLFASAVTGSLSPQTDTGLTYNATTDTLTATTFSGALSGNATSATTAAGLSATLEATSGGTGQSVYVIGDILYASTTTALSKLPAVATGNVLLSGGVGTASNWGKVGLTTHVSDTLPVANGGTGVTSSTGTGSVVLSTSPALTTATFVTSLAATDAAGPVLSDVAATSIVPTLIPNKADPNTGIGWVSADLLSLVAGGVSAATVSTAGTVTATLFSGVATSARYADVAEQYTADVIYEAGTVLIFAGDDETTMSTTEHDHRVAGVVSTNPAHLMNSELEGVPLALTGRVPCKVTGKVSKGDLMITSNVAGHAKADNTAMAGRIIGKALESKTTDGEGVIEVLVNMM